MAMLIQKIYNVANLKQKRLICIPLQNLVVHSQRSILEVRNQPLLVVYKKHL